VRTFGAAPGAHYRILDETTGVAGTQFTLEVDGAPIGSIAVPPGVKAAANAAATAAIALELGVEFEAIVGALASFGGVARRFQFRGERDGVAFVDDYAHLPGEVAAAIATAKHGPWRRVITVFQPHRYSRTATIGTQFADAFRESDALVLTDVYPAGEQPIPGVTGRTVLYAVLDRHPATPVAYLPRTSDLRDVPARMARPGDVVLTLGAGDLTAMPDVWMAAP
jgi:UDP-N-acetylmuramate--alanine ligase